MSAISSVGRTRQDIVVMLTSKGSEGTLNLCRIKEGWMYVLNKLVMGAWSAARYHGSLLTPTQRTLKSTKKYKYEMKQLNNSLSLNTCKH